MGSLQTSQRVHFPKSVSMEILDVASCFSGLLVSNKRSDSSRLQSTSSSHFFFWSHVLPHRTSCHCALNFDLSERYRTGFESRKLCRAVFWIFQCFIVFCNAGLSSVAFNPSRSTHLYLILWFAASDLGETSLFPNSVKMEPFIEELKPC